MTSLKERAGCEKQNALMPHDSVGWQGRKMNKSFADKINTLTRDTDVEKKEKSTRRESGDKSPTDPHQDGTAIGSEAEREKIGMIPETGT